MFSENSGRVSSTPFLSSPIQRQAHSVAFAGVSRNLHPTGKITNFYVNQRVFSKKTAFTAHFLTKREKWHTPHSENPPSDLDFSFNLNLNFNLNIF